MTSCGRMTGKPWVRAVLVVGALLRGLGGVSADEITPEWMTFNQEEKVVQLVMVASADGSNGTLNFNGFARDELTVTVPLGWKVKVELTNKGLGALPHSLAVTEEMNPLPIQDGTVAFPRATTVRFVAGLLPGESDDFSFTANKEGRFLLFCGVPSHGVLGMWNYLVVSKEALLPSITVKK